MTGMSPSYFVGVDVGTASVRAALVSGSGCVVKKSSHPIKINNPKQGTYPKILAYFIHLKKLPIVHKHSPNG
jgi:ribulose kinase